METEYIILFACPWGTCPDQGKAQEKVTVEEIRPRTQGW
jgi:hypothetical protein